jgi:cyanophycin synthetase
MFAVKRSPPSVRGDSKHTVAQLVERHNGRQMELPRWKRHPAIPIDAELEEVLTANGIALDTIPKKGTEVHLRYVESIRWGGQGEDVTATVHPANRELAQRCAALMKLRIAGIDMITEDISVPWYENDAIINEINYKPFFGNFHITRPYVGPFLENLMNGHDGRVPVIAFIGGEKAMKSALVDQAKAAKNGENWIVTDESRTLLPDGSEMPLVAPGLAARGRALTYDKAVGGILLVVRDDALLRANLVFDRIDKVVDCRTAKDRAEVGDAVVALLDDLSAA